MNITSTVVTIKPFILNAASPPAPEFLESQFEQSHNAARCEHPMISHVEDGCLFHRYLWTHMQKHAKICMLMYNVHQCTMYIMISPDVGDENPCRLWSSSKQELCWYLHPQRKMLRIEVVRKTSWRTDLGMSAIWHGRVGSSPYKEQRLDLGCAPLSRMNHHELLKP